MARCSAAPASEPLARRAVVAVGVQLVVDATRQHGQAGEPVDQEAADFARGQLGQIGHLVPRLLPCRWDWASGTAFALVSDLILASSDSAGITAGVESGSAATTSIDGDLRRGCPDRVLDGQLQRHRRRWAALAAACERQPDGAPFGRWRLRPAPHRHHASPGKGAPGPARRKPAGVRRAGAGRVPGAGWPPGRRWPAARLIPGRRPAATIRSSPAP